MVCGFLPTNAFSTDIARFRQRLDIGPEIAVGVAGEFLQLREFEARCGRQRVEGGHDLQPQRLVDDLVKVGQALAGDRLFAVRAIGNTGIAFPPCARKR